jgi:excisionase family DNA binding protein
MTTKHRLNIDEVAREMEVSRRTVFRWIKNGEIESVKIGGTRRIYSDSLTKKSDDQCQTVTAGDIKRF